MLNLKKIKKFDEKSMYKIYDKWDEIASNAYNNKFEILDIKQIDHIVFVGMGGSGTLGDVFNGILSKKNIHVSIVKGYQLPKTVDKSSLVVFTSVSGNTNETLSALANIKKVECKSISFSSGGLMEKYCKKNKLEFRKILQEHSPRASFVTYLYSMLKILEQGIPITNYEINSSIRELHELKFKIFSENLNENNPSLRLASRIKNIPLIYYPSGLQSAAMRFKNSLQENAKMHTIVEDIIETSHNGIVAWEKKSNVFPILLQGKDDHIKTKERWKILKEYFLKNQIDFEEVTSIKGDILSKITSLIYLLDYTSIYKSILTKTDPSPVKSIEFIKNRLR